jgi:hypothetical protein
MSLVCWCPAPLLAYLSKGSCGLPSSPPLSEILEGDHRVVLCLLLGTFWWPKVVYAKPSMVSPLGHIYELNHLVLARICAIENAYQAEGIVRETDFDKNLRYWTESHLPCWRKRPASGSASRLVDYSAYLKYLARDSPPFSFAPSLRRPPIAPAEPSRSPMHVIAIQASTDEFSNSTACLFDKQKLTKDRRVLNSISSPPALLRYVTFMVGLRQCCADLLRCRRIRMENDLHPDTFTINLLDSSAFRDLTAADKMAAVDLYIKHRPKERYRGAQLAPACLQLIAWLFR